MGATVPSRTFATGVLRPKSRAAARAKETPGGSMMGEKSFTIFSLRHFLFIASVRVSELPSRSLVLRYIEDIVTAIKVGRN
jgi:hypothetical protein